MKANDLKKLVELTGALSRALSDYEGDVNIETFETSVHLKMDLDESYLVLSGLADYDARIVDSYNGIVTIALTLKEK